MTVIKQKDIVNIKLELDTSPGAEWLCLGPVGSVWVFDFMLERFHKSR